MADTDSNRNAKSNTYTYFNHNADGDAYTDGDTHPDPDADSMQGKVRPAPIFVVRCVISRTRMETRDKIEHFVSLRRRWSSPNGTELLRHRRSVR